MGTEAAVGSVADVLFGRARREVLSLLFGRPDQAFYLREIVRATAVGTGAVQRELAALTEAGLLRREVRGRQVYFAANPDSPVFAELRGLIAKTSGLADVLRAALSQLAGQGRIEIAFIYGSLAAGKAKAASDVDLLILGDVRLRELASILSEVQNRLSREVNPTVYPTAEFRDRLKSKAHFLTRVLKGPKIFLVGDERELTRLAR